MATGERSCEVLNKQARRTGTGNAWEVDSIYRYFLTLLQLQFS